MSVSRVFAIGILTSGLAIGATPVFAQETSADPALLKQLFGRPVPEEGAVFACFTRSYDAAHLATHPRQRVRTMKLLVTARGETDGPAFTLGLDITFRKLKDHFFTGGSCWSVKDEAKANARPMAHCGVDCDGGAINVSLKDAKSVLVSIPDGARVTREGDDEETGGSSRRFGSDDKLFRLDRAKLTDCISLANDEDKTLLRRQR